jgi:hypothetical protein
VTTWNPYWVELGIPALFALVFLIAARFYNRAQKTQKLSQDFFRAPSTYVVTVTSVAFPLIGAIMALQPPDKMSATSRSLLVSSLVLFLVALLVGTWLTYAIISRAEDDKVELSFPGDWHYLGALGVSYVLLITGLINSFLYFAFGLNPEAPKAVARGGDDRALIYRSRPRIGQTKEALTRDLGAPDEQSDGGYSWMYQTENANVTVKLGVDGHVISITEAARNGK